MTNHRRGPDTQVFSVLLGFDDSCRDPIVYLKPWSSDYDKPPAEDQIRRSSVCPYGLVTASRDLMVYLKP
jgi:hypothetical protein